jgi:hypothetical protein
MSSHDHRKDVRLTNNFQVIISKKGRDVSLEGSIINLSQRGAFIKAKAWRAFKVREPVDLTLFLPPGFTGQDRSIGLQGSALVSRTDKKNGGIAVEFLVALKYFNRNIMPNIAEKIKYNMLAQYFATSLDQSLNEFVAAHPNGFILEKSQRLLNKNVISQLITKVVADEHALEEIKQEALWTEILEARVMEIRKKKSLSDLDTLTIGRSPDNDIVLHNKTVSGRHAYVILTSEDENCHLVDIGSTDGTFLNNNKIMSHETYKLADGDELSFGPEAKVIYLSSTAFYSFISGLKSSHH